MTRPEIDAALSRLMQTAAELEEKSDIAFARGDVGEGAKLFRHATLAYLEAERLAQRAAALRLARH